MVILGIDPGYAIVGWGVLDYRDSRFAIKGYGSITTRRGWIFPEAADDLSGHEHYPAAIPPGCPVD